MDPEYPNNANSRPEVLPVCRLCLEVSPISLYPAKCLDMCLYSIVPNLDLGLSKNPGVCINCTTILTNSYNLKVRCMNNQEKIINRYNASNESVDLYDFVRCFEKENHAKASNIPNTRENESLEDDKIKLLDISTYTKSNTLHSFLDIPYKEEPDMGESQSAKARNETLDILFNNNDEDQKHDKSKFLEVDEIIFNYTQEFQVNNAVKNESELSQKMGNQSSVEPTSSRTIWKKIGSQRYQCLLCRKFFVQKINLDGHLLNKHKDFPNIENNIKSKVHYCDYCKYRTINTYNLTSHMLSKHDIIRSSKHKLRHFDCFQCSYSTRNKGNLVLHMRTHSRKKFFECKYCQKSFKQKGALNNHYLCCHKEEISEINIDSLISATVYTCDKCQLKTLDKSRYKRHLRIHRLKYLKEQDME